MTAKICDKLWATAVKRAGKCEVEGCTGSPLQAHHIIPRTCWALRFDLENGVCLCKRHHLYWAHKDAIGFTEWVKNKRDLKYLESKRGNRQRHDYIAIQLYLTTKIDEK